MGALVLSREHPNIIHPGWYAEYGYPHDTWTRMRREDPVSYWDETEGTPFWAVTKHADIVEVGGQPELFKSGQRIVLQHDGEPEEFGFPPTLIQLDPPKHGRYRQLVNRRFTPGVLKKMRDDIERIGAEIVDGLVKDSDTAECDFVEKVAAPLPIAVIAWLMGVPREDWHLLFDWTNRAIAATDPEGPVRIEGFLCWGTGVRPSLLASRSCCADHLPAAILHDRCHHLERLPRTSTDKIDYPTLRSLT